MSNYRVLVQHDPERNVFVARAPELGQLSTEGATRAEALARIEEEIEAQLANIRERGGQPPPALDDAAAPYDGTIACKLSRSLHRELVWQARLEGIELNQLLSELLPSALEARRQRRRASHPRTESPVNGPGDEGGGSVARGSERDERGGRRGGFRGGGGRYHEIMEDRAAFLEYVRGLESGQGAGPRRGGGKRGFRRPEGGRDRGGLSQGGGHSAGPENAGGDDEGP